MWWGSARLREAGWQMATPTAPRQPYLFCPALHRALCSGSGAFSRLFCVGAVEGWEGYFARVLDVLGGKWAPDTTLPLLPRPAPRAFFLTREVLTATPDR